MTEGDGEGLKFKDRTVVTFWRLFRGDTLNSNAFFNEPEICLNLGR